MSREWHLFARALAKGQRERYRESLKIEIEIGSLEIQALHTTGVRWTFIIHSRRAREREFVRKGCHPRETYIIIVQKKLLGEGQMRPRCSEISVILTSATVSYI